jgi:hypothetical protein
MHQQTQDQRRALRSWRRLRPALALGLVALACSGTDGLDDTEPVRKGLDLEARPKPGQGGEVLPLERLPFVEPALAAETFLQRLREPTRQGENVAVHVRLPPPSNARLAKSLVRVLGEPENPLILFSSDALVQLGKLDKSPGPGFFTAFLQLDERELERRVETEKVLADVEDPSKSTLLFNGRTPVAITTGIVFDPRIFFDGGLMPLGPCPITPASVPARWEESLMITDPAVVQDVARTHDACTGAGDPNGVWTFKHLMAEMAIGSGLSSHDFVLEWLSNWLQPYVVNGDTVLERPQMFDQVILPWANQSGVTAALSAGGVLTLSGPLDLDLAPFRLSAIVNRIDLGATTSGPSGYGGGSTSQPVDAGELRFVFGVQNLDTCSVLRFSVIFEYGVPIAGCTDVRDWARDWTKLNDPAFASRFSSPWLAQLQGMTESVVKNGAAPANGNQSALNQIRTNEFALGAPWELREFTLSIENAFLGTDLPASGELRTHTVAMTPEDGTFAPAPHLVIDAFALGDVLSGVPPVVPVLPDDCSASFSVPGHFSGLPFRGGNSLTAPPTHWEAAVNAGDNREACARHELSLNTCNGCHFGDTATPFLHVDPTSMPAGLSNFLTGAGGIWSVQDPQFGGPAWTFADLERRFQRLYELACTSCGSRIGMSPDLIRLIVELNRAVPIDPIGPISRFPFEIGPIDNIEIAARLFEARGELMLKGQIEDVELDGAIHQVQSFVH